MPGLRKENSPSTVFGRERYISLSDVWGIAGIYAREYMDGLTDQRCFRDHSGVLLRIPRSYLRLRYNLHCIGDILSWNKYCLPGPPTKGAAKLEEW